MRSSAAAMCARSRSKGRGSFPGAAAFWTFSLPRTPRRCASSSGAMRSIPWAFLIWKASGVRSPSRRAKSCPRRKRCLRCTPAAAPRLEKSCFSWPTGRRSAKTPIWRRSSPPLCARTAISSVRARLSRRRTAIWAFYMTRSRPCSTICPKTRWCSWSSRRAAPTGRRSTQSSLRRTSPCSSAAARWPRGRTAFISRGATRCAVCRTGRFFWRTASRSAAIRWSRARSAALRSSSSRPTAAACRLRRTISRTTSRWAFASLCLPEISDARSF